MIRKSLLTGGLLLAVYTVLITLYGPAIHRTAQTTGQRNLVKAEEYLFEQNALADTVILGSSMSERIVFSDRCANLAMPGLSPHEGLALLKLSRHLPRVVLVEINTLDRQLNLSLLNELMDPTYRRLKQYLPFLRQKYQPVGVAKAVLRDWRTGGSEFVTPDVAMRIDTALREKVIAGHLEAARRPLADSTMLNALAQARQALQDLRQRGVQVILYEVPVDYRLQNIPASQLVRSFVQQHFPTSEYAYISLPAARFETSDGIHLTVAEAPRYTNYLHQSIYLNRATAEARQAKN